jgi:hypothetical protein
MELCWKEVPGPSDGIHDFGICPDQIHKACKEGHMTNGDISRATM